jgi:glyoxylase I family protein
MDEHVKNQSSQVHIHHVAVQTEDFDKAFDFYTELLGLQVIKKRFDYKKRTLAWLDGGGIMIELFSIKSDETPQPYDDRHVGTVHIAFEVQDIDTIIAHLVKHDVKIIKPPFLPKTNDPYQPRVAFIEGPDGEEIEIREQSHAR